MYVVREGTRRGKGAYLTKADIHGFDLWYYTRRKKRARRFNSPGEALHAAKMVFHVTQYRAVRLVSRADR